MEAAVTDLQAHKATWVATSIRERIELLSLLMASFARVADRWTAAAMAAEGLAPEDPGAGEEALVGPYLIARNLRLLRRTLSDVERFGSPRLPAPQRTLPSGQVVAPIFPADLYDRIFYGGVTAEAWMEPGVTRDGLAETMGAIYRAERAGGPRQPAVALVISAGNVSSIGPMDALYKLFAEDQVVLYKTHPVNAYLGPLFAEGFAPLVERGFLRIVYGGAEEGAFLCDHPGIEAIHITGSDRTYDAIVWGPGEEGKRRKAARQRRLQKPVSAELGNVSPVIVVPGPWSDSDFAYHAENLASMLTNNAGFNCNATRVIVQHAGWEGSRRLLDGVRGLLSRVPPRKAYYPGAAQRFDAFVAAHPDRVELFGERRADRLPWALIPDLDPQAKDDICFQQEAFCSLFAETELAAASVPDFLARAVEFCNDTLWGTLNASVIVHPATLRDGANRAAFEQAIADLRYGTVSINHWAGVGYGLVVTPWGAFPGHPPHDIRSGTGVVHNTLLFDRVQKAVVRAPFRARPKPVWFITHRTALAMTPRLVRFEAAPSLAKLPGILGPALRG
jgi:acyl-CoA reductase-like NAD-dependent aldehyde dehydrogenase